METYPRSLAFALSDAPAPSRWNRITRTRRKARVHAFALLFASALASAAAPARAEGETDAGPCDDLVAYLGEALGGPIPRLAGAQEPWYEAWERRLEGLLRSTRGDTMPRAFVTRVTPACRAATRHGAAPTAAAAARALTQRREPGWVDRGRILLCTMQDPGSLDDVADWIADPVHAAAQAVCASELATWPGAEPLRDPIFERAVRKLTFGWEIDPAVVAAANVMGTRELREQLVPVLVSAYAHRALGYDRLRDAVCTEDSDMSIERGRACSTLPAGVEAEWPRSEPTRRWLAKGAATGVFAGAITAAALERNHEAGRAIATGAGVPLGASLGLALAPPVSREPGSATTELRSIVCAVVGGLVGGLATDALSAKPSARATVTAVALAPVYLVTVVSLSVD
jgi:hypothetical protein